MGAGVIRVNKSIDMRQFHARWKVQLDGNLSSEFDSHGNSSLFDYLRCLRPVLLLLLYAAACGNRRFSLIRGFLQNQFAD